MKFLLKLTLAVFLLLPLYPHAAGAVEPDEVLSDPALEKRARIISKELRCLVCQNQSIDDSDANLAKDLRVLVRERLVEGETNDQVIDYIVSRYGDYVLLRPPFNMATLFLWIGPIIFVLLGIIGIYFFMRRQGASIQTSGDIDDASPLSTSPPPLTAEETNRLKTLLEGDEK